MSKGEGSKKDRKKNYWTRLDSLLDEYGKILIVTADNVGSNHMQKIRKAMRGKAVLLMGKNTMIRKAMRDHITKMPALEFLLPYIKGNIGLVFTNGDLPDIRTKLTELKIQAAAKAGALAPIEVTVPAGNTGMEPTKTSFFQALSIPTKINRGTIEILNDIHLLTVGQKVSLSQAALLQMLGIRPFQYGLKVTTVFDDPAVYPAIVLDLTDADIIKKFYRGVSNLAALSLQIGYPTVVSVPHTVANGYKNLLAISIATDYTFPGSEKIKQLLSDPAAFAAAQAAAAPTTSAPVAGGGGGGAAPAPEVKKPEKPDKDPEEEVDEDMGSMFGDEDEGY